MAVQDIESTFCLAISACSWFAAFLADFHLHSLIEQLWLRGLELSHCELVPHALCYGEAQLILGSLQTQKTARYQPESSVGERGLQYRRF